MSKEEVVALSDIVGVLRRGRKKLFLAALFCASLAVFYVLSRPVVYQAEATFRERENQDAGVGGSVFEMFTRGANKNVSHAVSTMKSRSVCARVVKVLDLQGCAVPKRSGFPRLGKIKNNLVAAYAHFRHRQISPFADYLTPLECTGVVYDGEVTQSFEVRFVNDADFSVFDGRGKKLGKGSLGAAFSFEDVSFTLKKNPIKSRLSSKRFIVVISPLDKAAAAIAAGLDVDPDEDDKNLLCITYKHPSRLKAAAVVNTVMEQYQASLKEESSQATSRQLEYLKQRKEEMSRFVQDLMAQQAKACADDVIQTGFVDTEKQLEFLARSQAECRSRLMNIDLELKRLQRLQEGGLCVYYDHFSPTGDAEMVNRHLMAIRDLKQQRDALFVALQKTPFSGKPLEFEGVDLATASQLYLSYNRQLDDVESKIYQNDFLLAEIEDPLFDISSLSGALADPVSHEIIGKASQLLLKARDENNLTMKELERLKEGVEVQRGFLANHLRQTKELGLQQKTFISSKLASLQRTNWQLIDEQISLKEQHLNQYLSSRTENLAQEKGLLEGHLQALQRQMASLPQKWVNEQIVRDYLSLNQRVAKEITELVEAKSLKSNLELVQSSPLDEAGLPRLPKKPPILFFAFIGGFLGFFVAATVLLFRSLSSGVVASSSRLTASDFHCSGTLSARCGHAANISDADLATLRRLIAHLFSGTEGTCLLVESRGAHFAPVLASLLSKMGVKVLVLPLSFDRPQDTGEASLLDYLEGSSKKLPTVKPREGYDEVVAGGSSRFGPELVSSATFKKLLDGYRQKYDWTVAWVTDSAVSAQVSQMLPLFDSAAVTVVDETVESLEYYRQRNVSFVLQD